MFDKKIPAFVLTFFAVIVSTCSAQPPASDPPISVELSSPQRRYLLGEPVSLRVAVTNTTDEPLRMLNVVVEKIEPEIQVYISSDGKHYGRWKLGMLPAGEIEREFQLLNSGVAEHYSVRVLYQRSRPSRLAFPDAGQYWVKVRFPLVLPGKDRRTEVESNPVVLQVERPQGIALEMWNEINRGQFLLFLQTRGARVQLALEAAALVQSVENTPYHDDLRAGLREFYRNRQRELSEHEAQLIRDVTGIKEKKPEKLFAHDDRLDEMVTYEFPKDTAYEEVLQKIARQHGVPLEVHPELRDQMLASLRITQPLREFMTSRAAESKARWMHKGKGYMLVPMDHAEQQEE